MADWDVTSEVPADSASKSKGGDWDVTSEKKIEPMSKLERFGSGLMDPVVGATQLVLSPIPYLNDYENDYVKRREADIKARSPEGFDPVRAAGEVGNPLNYIPAGAGVKAGEEVVQAGSKIVPYAKKVAESMAGGGKAAAIEPVTDTKEGFASEKAGQIETGSTVGGVIGAIASPLSRAAKAFGSWLSRDNPSAPEDKAVKKVLDRIESDKKAGGPTAQNALDLVNAAGESGKPITLADVGGPNVKGLAGAVARQPGPSKSIVRNFLEERDTGANDRLTDDIKKYLSSGDSAHKTTKALLEARSAAARPAYSEVEQLQNIWSPRLQQFIDDPAIKKGMSRGYEIERLQSLAENRPFDPTQMGIDLDADGNVKILKKPNMRVLDMAKQGLDAMIADERNEITGRLSAKGVALDKARRAYLTEMDNLDTSGKYRAARESWAGHSASLDAIRSGKTLFQRNPEEIADEMKDLSTSDREFYRLGAADTIRERLAKVGMGSDEAKAIIKNKWTHDQLKPLFDNEEQFNKFVESVTHESTMFNTRNSLVKNSLTAEREAEDAAHSGALSSGAKAAHGAITGNWYGALRNSYEALKHLGIKPDLATNEEIARILFQTPITPESKVGKALAGAATKQPPINHLEGASALISESPSVLAPASSALATSPQ